MWKEAQGEMKQSASIRANFSGRNFPENLNDPAFCRSSPQTYWRNSWSRSCLLEVFRVLSLNCQLPVATTRLLAERVCSTKPASPSTEKRTKWLSMGFVISVSRSGSVVHSPHPKVSRERKHSAQSASKLAPFSLSAKTLA